MTDQLQADSRCQHEFRPDKSCGGCDSRCNEGAAAAWHRRTGPDIGQFEMRHAWCVPRQYSVAGWVTGRAGEVFDLDMHDCDGCGASMGCFPR